MTYSNFNLLKTF